jgi:hypothetical protein
MTIWPLKVTIGDALLCGDKIAYGYGRKTDIRG